MPSVASDCVPSESHPVTEVVTGEAIQVVSILGNRLRQAAERFRDSRIQLTKLGKDSVPDLVAGRAEQKVRRIFSRANSRFGAVALGLFPGQMEERTGEIRALAERPRGARAHAGKPVEAAPADKVEENRLGLVIEGVTGEDAGSAGECGLFGEEVVAETAGGVFEGLVITVSAASDIADTVNERDVQLRGERTNEIEVSGGFVSAAEHVVEVGDGEIESELGA